MSILSLVVSSVLVLPLAPSSSAQTTKPAAQAPAPTPASFTPEALDTLLAPVALYPDQLLTQMLLCTSDPAMIQKLSGWLVRNSELTGTALQDAAEKEGYGPSFVVLTMFPQVVNFMADNIKWTRELGKAFAADREGVIESVQRLRAKAKAAGTLKTTPQQKVETKTTTTGEQVIVIEPANPQVVYVPQYNPQVVYVVQQPTTTSSTVVVKEDDDSAEAAVVGALVGFTAGIAIGAAMDNDYYYGPYGWHGGAYMYNDAWDDFYDDREDAREDFYEHREDAREDWQDHREDTLENRSDRANEARENRSTTTQQQRTERAGTTSTERQANRAQGQTQSATTASAESRGRSTSDRTSASQRSSSKSDAFSGYSSGSRERSASSRGSGSRGSRSGGGGRRK